MSETKMLPNVTDVVCAGNPDNKMFHFKWVITNWCNYNCSYCTMKEQLDPQWSKTNSVSSYKLTLSRLKRFDQPFELELFGGEPTLHPNIADILAEVKNIQKCVLVHITTNLSRSISFFRRLNSLGLSNLHISASLHCEYYTEDFLKKVKAIHDMEFMGISVIVNLSSKKEDWPLLLSVIDQLEEWGVHYSLNYLVDMPFWQAGYTDEFFEIFSPIEKRLANSGQAAQYKYCMGDGSVQHLTSLQVHQGRLDEFRGYKCTSRFFEIDFAGTFVNTCTRRVAKPILVKARDLEVEQPCPRDSCPCSMMYDVYKVKA